VGAPTSHVGGNGTATRLGRWIKKRHGGRESFIEIDPHASIVDHEGYRELAALHAPDAHNLHELKKKQKSRERAGPAFFYKPKEVQY
jgi:hypothetical protein